MAANPTIYCLEEITDYSEFERLCTDLMSRHGYPSIEPLGRFKDKGRDAIHVNRQNSITAIFAYSVREDWRAKLSEDAGKIKQHGHSCDRFVFVSTARFTAGERDEAVASIKNDFGWDLELYGVERLRIMLDIDHPEIKKLYPQIFPPAMLALDIDSYSSPNKEYVFISFAPEDGALANWLAQKLTLEGYKVWHESLFLGGGENYTNSIDDVISKRSAQVIALYSRASLKNAEVVRQRVLAAASANSAVDFIVPLNIDNLSIQELDRSATNLQFISFGSWSVGLEQLLKKLNSVSCPRPFASNGKHLAAEAFIARDTISGEPEDLILNCLEVKKLPQTIYLFRGENINKSHIGRLRSMWSFKSVANEFLSFQNPPSEMARELALRMVEEFQWDSLKDIKGIAVGNLISELLRRSLEVKLREKGLQYCWQSKLIYFPRGLAEKDHLNYVRPNGQTAYVNVYGKRKYWKPSQSDEYLYHLAPEFRVRQNLFGIFTITLRLRVRMTDTKQVILPDRAAISRRKHLCKDWWNDDWLNRILAVCQYIGDDELIVIGLREEEQIIISSAPMVIRSPKGLDETNLLRKATEERAELLESLEDEEVDQENLEQVHV